MSLVNVWVTPQKAMVVVDTEAQSQEGEYFETSKMLTLPHANVVVAGRGHNAFFNVLFSLLHMDKGATFDDLEGSFDGSLAQTTAYLKTIEAQFIRSIYEQEIALVGYSHSRRGMHCVAYQSKDESGFAAHDIDDAYLSPWDPTTWGLPMPVTTAEHARVASTEQLAKAKALHPDAPLGGRLLLAEVTRDELTLSVLGTLTHRASL